MLTLTSPVKTPLHQMRAGPKLATLALFTFALFWTTSPLHLGIALVAVVALYLTGGTQFARHGARMLRPLWPFVAVVGLWHLWLDDLTAGAVVLLRMGAAVAAANLVTVTTRLSDMITVLERLARPLAPLLPPQRLALAIALVIRFIPVLSERAAQLGQAYRARSGRAPGWRLFAPAALAALDDAENVSQALRARGGTG
ncbi:MAG: energy-coupling factor transporter transmembrane component T [Pseudotabrizicola sp.]|uniref:energy-coupling factor transporter transmembrane component T family protein n=1 Tax=Pseudotabrizicola sp. TaxID=2939647 RepID=UPI00272F0390|nr:energy-coupling factor transporter transmembrane component T [Pseudotabrizicola sp.]MDP2080057.1 energy-coupling factor transporter transmembrane component T [Pseudotabrizicola sp.]MDZ7575503.1 energy-coupling factor transporter transmembrane component T [Pseudotabrizicola sp.]